MAAGILYSRCFFVFFIVIKKTPRIQYLLLASITGAFFFFKIKKKTPLLIMRNLQQLMVIQ